jgi:hypothetical protein
MAYDWSKANLNSNFGDWSKLGSNQGGKDMSFFAGAGGPILGGLIGLGGNILQGQADREVANQQRKSAKEQALYGMLGTMQAANDARAARATAGAMNVFGQLGGSLYNAPIDFKWQRYGKEEDLQRFMPMQFAMAREESRLGEEQEQTPLFRKGREDAARMDRLAGRYAAALPAMTQWGQFNLPNV